MAGSRRWFQYVDDSSAAYAMEQDESNGVAVGNDLLATVVPTLPKRIKPRYVVAEWQHSGVAGEGTGKSTRKIVVGKIADYAALDYGDTVSLPDYQSEHAGASATPNVMRDFVVTVKMPERILRAPRIVETGMDEG